MCILITFIKHSLAKLVNHSIREQPRLEGTFERPSESGFSGKGSHDEIIWHLVHILKSSSDEGSLMFLGRLLQ